MGRKTGFIALQKSLYCNAKQALSKCHLAFVAKRSKRYRKMNKYSFRLFAISEISHQSVAISSFFFEIPKLPQKTGHDWATCFFTITKRIKRHIFCSIDIMRKLKHKNPQNVVGFSDIILNFAMCQRNYNLRLLRH